MAAVADTAKVGSTRLGSGTACEDGSVGLPSDSVPAGADDGVGLRAELAAALAEIERLRGLLGLDQPPAIRDDGRLFAMDADSTGRPEATVDRASPPAEKLALFARLFGVRSDVFALRWENSGSLKSGWAPVRRGRDGPLVALTDDVLRKHLEGGHHVGVYPLRPGDQTSLLVLDFDSTTWALDARAVHDAAVRVGLCPALERSRSGQGAHVWIFFTGPVPAAAARQVGAGLIRLAMDERAELDLASYDRMFPSQDTLPANGFGNLIALPLQGACRRNNTTVFLNPATLEPYEDQWAFLSTVANASPEDIAQLAGELDPFTTTTRPTSKTVGPRSPAPPVVRAELGAGVSIERTGLPGWLVADLKHAASMPNPEFFEKQRMRFSTWNTPRVIRCYSETLDRLILPRGLLAQVEQILTAAGSRLEVHDSRPTPPSVPLTFTGTLRPEQQTAVDAIAGFENGMVIAPPGTGKTVIGCALIAAHQTPTLILVDRRPLADQWRERLTEFLELKPSQIGQTGGGRKRLTGHIDIALLQSVARLDQPAELFEQYGLVIVDECHHAPATSYEPVLATATTRRWIGLTATPFRADRLDPLIGFYCGPIRHQIPADQTPAAALARQLHLTTTSFALTEDTPHIQDVFRALANDPHRNQQITADIAELARQGRRTLVLSQRKDHLALLTAGLADHGIAPLLLVGGQTPKQSRAVIDQLTAQIDTGGPVVALSTGSYVGEGFDLPGLDTLLLAFPVAFKSRIIQYVGRLLRPDPTKTDIAVHDYHDPAVPVLVAMARKRHTTYRQLGFTIPTPNPAPTRTDDAF